MSEQLVALTPSEVPVAQTQLVEWCTSKIVALGRDLAQARRNLTIVKEAGWSKSSWVRHISKTRDRMIYYAKIKAAVRAGYLIIPNFDIDVLVCRVSKAKPRWKSADYEKYDITHAAPELLPPGVGRYVDDKLITDVNTYQLAPDAQGNKKTRTRYTRVGYDEDIDFPILAVKPAILEATHRAMVLRLFDRIGIVSHQSKSDPIVLGQIIDPKHGDRLYHPKVVSFFIAWWLDPEVL